MAAHLARRHRHSTEGVWLLRIGAGEVFLEGVAARPDDLLRSGQSLVWRRPPWEEPDVPLGFACLYLDAHLLAVAKPRGLPSIPAGGFLDHTLLRLVRDRFPEATPMHRLGRGTSGLLLFARTPEARRGVAESWRKGGVEKIYRALVTGVPSRSAFSVEARIGLVRHPRLGRVYAASREGKAALTHVRVLATTPTGETIVEATIPTGRPHQIRIHLAAAGHPLVGDPLYGSGGVPMSEPGLPGDPGYRLHSHRLGLVHPITKERLDLECAPPGELRT